MVTEYTMGLNDLNQPREYHGTDAINLFLMRLILVNPGTFPEHPDLGVGLVANYRYITKDKLDELKDKIKEQITKYLPQYSGVEVNLILQGKTLFISITIDDTIYQFKSDGTSLKKVELSDL